MRPRGVVSKNAIGARRIRLSSVLCIALEAEIDPYPTMIDDVMAVTTSYFILKNKNKMTRIFPTHGIMIITHPVFYINLIYSY